MTVQCDADEDYAAHELTGELVQGAVFACVGLGAIVLNVVLSYVYSLRNLDKATNLVLLFITLSDVGGGVVGLYSGLYLISAKRCWFDLWKVDEFLCILMPMLWLCCCTATTLLVPLISIVRFIAVFIPLKFYMLTRTVIIAILSSISLISVSSAIYPLVLGDGFFKITTYPMCIFNLHSVSPMTSYVYGWIFNFIPTITSVVIIVITNSGITFRIIYQTKKVMGKPSQVAPAPTVVPAVPPTSIMMNRLTVEGSPGQEDSLREISQVSSTSETLKPQPSNDKIPKINKTRSSLQSMASAIGNLARRGKDKPSRPSIINGQSKTVILLALLYVTCYIQKLVIYTILVCFPSLMYHELLVLIMSEDAANRFMTVSDYCVTINSFLNPLVYFAFSRKIRKEFIDVVLCRSKNPESTTMGLGASKSKSKN